MGAWRERFRATREGRKLSHDEAVNELAEARALFPMLDFKLDQNADRTVSVKVAADRSTASPARDAAVLEDQGKNGRVAQSLVTRFTDHVAGA